MHVPTGDSQGDGGGRAAQTLLGEADPRHKASEEDLLDALDGDLSAEHRLVLTELLDHIRDLQQHMAALRQAPGMDWRLSRPS